MLQPLPLPQVGQAIGGKYLVERTLGEGGMGVVFEVKHAQLHQRFAVKLLRPEIVRDSEAVARFEREARAAASLTSRHVCRVTDVGAREDGTPFMVMECLEGEDLGSLLERQGPLPLGDVARYLLEACEAMEEAHARGIVHRDLKPENLFLARMGSGTVVKVLDFGISKRAEDNAVNVTRTQSSLGTPLYMSPEQTRSTKHVDARTDIWSMGVILYELLSGEVPFKGETPGQVAVSVAVDKVVPLRSYRPDLPEAIEQVIAGALAKDPSDRYPTIRAFAAALTPFAVGFDTSHWSRPPPPLNPTHPVDRTGSKPNLETATTLHVQTTQQSRASGRMLWIGGAALAVIVLGGAFALGSARVSNSGSPEPRPGERPVVSAEPAPTASAVAATPANEPTITPSSVVSAPSATVEKPIKAGVKVAPSTIEKPTPPKPAATGGPLPTRL